MLTWLDTLKIVVAVVTPFALFLIRTRHLRRTERIRKQRSLWRALDQETLNLVPTLSNLEELEKSLESGRIKFIHYDLPEFLIEFSGRLCELDPRNTFAYTDFIAWVEIVRQGFANLSGLLTQVLSSPRDSEKRVRDAAIWQITALRFDLVSAAVRQLQVMEAIAPGVGGDPQIITRAKNDISRGKGSLPRPPA